MAKKTIKELKEDLCGFDAVNEIPEEKEEQVIDDSWDGLDNQITNEYISQLKSMTDSQLKRQGEIENIPNYALMTRQELLDALISKAGEVEE